MFLVSVFSRKTLTRNNLKLQYIPPVKSKGTLLPILRHIALQNYFHIRLDIQFDLLCCWLVHVQFCQIAGFLKAPTLMLPDQIALLTVCFHRKAIWNILGAVISLLNYSWMHLNKQRVCCRAPSENRLLTHCLLTQLKGKSTSLHWNHFKCLVLANAILNYCSALNVLFKLDYIVCWF